jgi:hypothetical protein
MSALDEVRADRATGTIFLDWLPAASRRMKQVFVTLAQSLLF